MTLQLCSETATIWLAGSSMLNETEVCMGRGTCDLGVCACDPMWTGQADYFPLNSCQNPVVLDKLAWALAAFMQLRLMFRARGVYSNQWNLYRETQKDVAKNGTSRKRSLAVFYAASVLMLFCIPALAAVFIVRSATTLHFGVDLWITLVYTLVYSVYMVAIAVIEHQLFRIMVTGASSLNPSRVETAAVDLIKLDLRTKTMGTTFYCALHIATTVTPVFFRIGPNAGRIAPLVVGNVTSVLYFFLYFISHEKLMGKLRDLLGSGDQTSNSKMIRVLSNILESTERSKKVVIMLFIVNMVFTCVPQLFTFNYVKNAALLILSTGKSHPLLMMSNGSGASSSQETRNHALTGSKNGSKVENNALQTIAALNTDNNASSSAVA